MHATVAVVKSIPQKTAQAKMSVKRHAKVTANYKRHVASGLVGVAATKCGITTYTVDSMYMCVTLYICVLSPLFVSAIYILHNYLKMPTTERTTTEQLLLMRQQQQQQQPHSSPKQVQQQQKANHTHVR